MQINMVHALDHTWTRVHAMSHTCVDVRVHVREMMGTPQLST